VIPLLCDTCAPSRESYARFSISFTVLIKGGTKKRCRWSVCGDCLPTCLEAAFAQYRPEYGRPSVGLIKRTVPA
jgi:hypothetical protein